MPEMEDLLNPNDVIPFPLPKLYYVGKDDEVPDVSLGTTLYLDVETYAGDYGTPLTVQANRIRLITVLPDAPYPAMDPETGATGENHVAFLFDMLDASQERWRQVFDFIESYEIICGHNLAFDLPILIRHGMMYPRKMQDTMVASRVLRNGTVFRHTLQNLVLDRLKFDMPKDLAISDWRARTLTDAQQDYARLDVAVLPHLCRILHGRLNDTKLMATYELECAILAPVASMTLNGVLIDQDHWVARSRKAKTELEKIQKEILAGVPLPDVQSERVERKTKKGYPYVNDVKHNRKVREYNATRCWNLASPSQVIQMLGKLEINVPKSNYETLSFLKDKHPIIEQFLHWRDLEKQAGTFGEDWLDNLHPDGRVYPSWWQLGAASGRFTCSSPNMQQVPRLNARGGIIASSGKVLIRADFSQIEARVAAYYSQDPVLIDLFQKGEDIHVFAAKAVLGKLEVTPEERQIGKSLVFGLLFSMSAPSLQVYCAVNYGVRFSSQQAEVFRDRFFRTFPGLARWHDTVRKTCCVASEFRTRIGRRRIVRHLNYGQKKEDTVLKSEEKKTRKKKTSVAKQSDYVNMLGLGLNTPVQGSAADMLKISVRELWDSRDEYPEFKLIMLVHDEIVGECPEDQAEEVAAWVKKTMIEVGDEILKPIPCDVSIKIGKTWGG